MEEWRDIPGWEGYYQASTLGRIKSLNYNRTKKEHIIKTVTDGRYCVAFFCKNGKREHFKWHLIIAKTFPELIQNEWFPGAEIDHINGTKTDNRPENLRWVSHKLNMCNPNTQIETTNKKKMIVMFDDGQDLCYFFSVKGASEELHTSRTNIIRCCKGIRKTASGYHWRYV